MAVKDVVGELHLRDLGSDLFEDVQAHQRPASAQSQSKVTAYRMRGQEVVLSAYHGGDVAAHGRSDNGAAYPTAFAPAS